MSDVRQTYLVEADAQDWGAQLQACRAVLTLVRGRTRRMSVDAYSDYRDDLPDDVAEVERRLRQRGESQHGGDPGMNVALDPGNDADWADMCTYGPWSIAAELWEEDDEPLAMLNDSAASIVVELTEDEARQLAGDLADMASVLPLEVAAAEREASDRADRAARRARLREWIGGMFRGR